MRLVRTPPATRRAAVLPILLLSLAATACAAGEPAPTATQTPEPTSTPEPMPSTAPASAAPSEDAGTGVVVTFRVADAEEYRILLTDPADIAIAEQLLAGEEAPSIPNGLILRDGDGGVNIGYSWHIDPASVEFAELTIEVCDGLPSHVESGSLSGERFCPWSAEVIDIQPAG
jgi:hypothetical protein